MTRRVTGPADRHAERMLDRGDSRCARARRQLRHDRQRDGAKPGRLDFPLDQSHGPAAHRSNRGQHHHIDRLLAKLPHHSWQRLPEESAPAGGFAELCEFSQSLDWQYRVRILLSKAWIDVKVAHLNVARSCRVCGTTRYDGSEDQGSGANGTGRLPTVLRASLPG